MRVKAEAPCRIDLAGGTLDIHPLYLFLPEACTVNLAINLTTEVEIEEKWGEDTELESLDLGISWSYKSRENSLPPPGMKLAVRIVSELAPEGGLKIKTRSNSPAGAGLGASSSLCVALVSALLARRGQSKPVDELVRYCLDLEAGVLGTPAGYQDFYAAANGGLQEIRFRLGEVYARPLETSLLQFENRITLVYTGRPHHSGLNNWEVFKRFIDGDDETRSALAEIGYIAAQMAGALRSGDWNAVIALLRKEWEQRKRLWPGIATPVIDSLIQRAQELGGAGKVCGAGGGGCVILLHDASVECKNKLVEAAIEFGAAEIEWSPVSRGCRVKIEQ